MDKQKRKKVITAIVVIIYAVIVIMCIVSGATKLVGKGSAGLHENAKKYTHISGKVFFAKEAIEYKHRLNGIIPLGTEHYYIVAGENMKKFVLVRADESWYEDNFDSAGIAKKSVYVDGCMSEFSTKMRSNVRRFNINNSLKGISINESKYVDLSYVKNSWIKLAAGFFNIIGLVLCFAVFKKKNNYDNLSDSFVQNKNIGFIGAACVIIGLFLVTRALIIW